jgi:hypothetical protein
VAARQEKRPKKTEAYVTLLAIIGKKNLVIISNKNNTDNKRVIMT